MRAITTLAFSAGLAAALALSAGRALADQPEDAWITAKVKSSLLTDDAVNGLDVDVDTFDGRVTLHGPVHSEAQKAKAERLARAVDGVKDVQNLLAIVPEAEREATEVQDEEIEKAVSAALESDPKLAGSSIEVESVTQGVVVLTGSAETMSAQRRATAKARAVKGVRRVASQIQGPDELTDAEIWQEPGSQAEKSASSDAWITTKVKLGLISEPGISPTRVNVDTEDGVVTLFGTVDSEDHKRRAVARARETEGVARVEDQLEVVPDVAASKVEANDEQLTSAVEKRIGERTSLADADIDVAAANGVVRLTGTVASRRDQLTALTVARSTAGVSSVVDGLELKQAGD